MQMNGIGAHEVIIETPNHALTIAEMPEKQIEEVLWAFKDRVSDLKKDRRFRYILLFKNHGEAAGASLEHPHCQLIALPVIPKRAKDLEWAGSQTLLRFEGALHLLRHHPAETTGGARLVIETDRFVVPQPYAPRFPFETWILPKVHESHETSSAHAASMAWVLRSTMRKIDKVLEQPAYNFIVQSAPVQAPLAHYHWHLGCSRALGWPDSNGGLDSTSIRLRPKKSARFLREAEHKA